MFLHTNVCTVKKPLKEIRKNLKNVVKTVSCELCGHVPYKHGSAHTINGKRCRERQSAIKFFECENCLHPFTVKKSLKRHKEDFFKHCERRRKYLESLIPVNMKPQNQIHPDDFPTKYIFTKLGGKILKKQPAIKKPSCSSKLEKQFKEILNPNNDGLSLFPSEKNSTFVEIPGSFCTKNCNLTKKKQEKMFCCPWNNS